MANPVPTYDANGKLIKQPTQWAETWWASLGIPSDVATRIDKLIAGYTDQAAAKAAAQTYLRTTDWYKQTFPGIEYGVRNGLFADESGYRQYVNELNNIYQQQIGRQATGTDAATWLMQGKNVDYIAKYIAGQASTAPGTVGAQQAQALAGAQGENGMLSQRELAALGEQNAGLTSPLGQKIAAQMDAAAKRLQGVFQGTAGTPSISLGPQGPFSQTLQGQKATDIGA